MPDLTLFWSFVVSWVFIGAVLFAWYGREIKMVVDLGMPIFGYDSPDWMSESQVRFLVLTVYFVVFLMLWPWMAADLERLK